jgi:hypothetical protein
VVLFGGYGSQAMMEIAERLDDSKLELQLIFICGRNGQKNGYEFSTELVPSTLKCSR